MTGAEFSYLGDRLERTGFVVSQHNADQLRCWVQQLAKTVDPDDTLLGHRDRLHVESQTFELFGWCQDTGMFDGGHKDLTGFASGYAADSQIIGFRTSAGEDDPIHMGSRSVASQSVRDFFPGIFQNPSSVPARLMLAGRVGQAHPVAAMDRVCNARVDGRGRIVVQVDRFHDVYRCGPHREGVAESLQYTS
jgi:hypothetical protein